MAPRKISLLPPGAFLARHVAALWAVLILSGCTSPSDVLGPAQSTELLAPEERLDSPSFRKLSELLQGNGYAGVGMQYETSRVNDLLFQVFSDPRTRNRELKLIYTGISMSYDASYQSLTIGGFTDAESVIRFIDAKVPKRITDKPTSISNP